MSPEINPETESQVNEQPRVTLYVKPKGCQPCKATVRKLDEQQIKYNKIVVKDDHLTLIDELKLQASTLGVAGELPCVNVFYPATGDERTWFGFQPGEIENILKGTTE